MRTTKTIKSWNEDGRRISLDIIYGKRKQERSAPSYCRWCGSLMVFELLTVGVFDEYGGKEEIDAWVVCPKRSTWSPWSPHMRYKLRALRQDHAQELMYEGLIDEQAQVRVT